MQRTIAQAWDFCAVGLSALCSLHCLGLPLLVAALPLLALSVDDHLLHIVLVTLAAPITLRVVWHAVTSGGETLFAATATTGLALLVIALGAESLETPLTVVGGGLLGTAHVVRWLRHRKPSVDSSVLDDNAERR